MAEKEMRNFALRDEKGNEIGVFTGKSPPTGGPESSQPGPHGHQAAGAGTKKVLAGERMQVDKPKGATAWMPDKIWKPMAKKVGVEKLEEVWRLAFSVFEAEGLISGGRLASWVDPASPSPPPAPFSLPSTSPPWTRPPPSPPGPRHRSGILNLVTSMPVMTASLCFAVFLANIPLLTRLLVYLVRPLPGS